MKQSIFLTLTTVGLFVSGLTWAGPPDGETQEVQQTQDVQDMPEAPISQEPAPVMPDKAPEPEILSFEEAVSLCAYEIDVQACVDDKTGQDRIADQIGDDMAVDPIDEMGDAIDGEMDSEIVIDPEDCDLDGNGMEDCPE